MHEVTCGATRIRRHDGLQVVCGKLLNQLPYPVVQTGNVYTRYEQVDYDGACWVEPCGHGHVGGRVMLTEYTYHAPDVSSIVLLQAIPYHIPAHAVLADRWRAGILTAESPSYALLLGWNLVRGGVPAVVDVQLRMWAGHQPGQPWPNGMREAEMPGGPLWAAEGM